MKIASLIWNLVCPLGITPFSLDLSVISCQHVEVSLQGLSLTDCSMFLTSVYNAGWEKYCFLLSFERPFTSVTGT